MKILTISLGRRILDTESRERERMRSYAAYTEELHIIVLTRKEHGYKDEQHEERLHLYPTHSSSRTMMLLDAFRISKKIITEGSPFVISAQDPLEIGWLSFIISKVTGAQLHIQVHGDYFSSDNWVGNSITRKIRRRMALVLLKHVLSVRVVSKRIKESLIARGVDEKKITVLPIRPELENFLQTPYLVRSAPPYRFLYIGRLAPEKDILRIVHAFALLHTTHKDIELCIVGEGVLKEKIEKVIEEQGISGAVSLLPWTEDVAGEMSRADVFLLASQHEAYALTLIEAMAVGVPVITTDVGCVGEVVLDGVHGIVVHESGVVPYKEAMQKMIEGSAFRESCSHAGNETARTLAETTPLAYARAWVTSVSHANKSV